MRLIIDLQGTQTQSARRGVGRFTRALTDAMIREAGGHEIILACNARFPEAFVDLRRRYGQLLAYDRIRAWRSPAVRTTSVPHHWRTRMGEPIREAFFADLQPDAVHVSSLVEGLIDEAVTSIGRLRPELPTGTMLFDLTPMAMRDKFLHDPLAAAWYAQKIEHIKRADLHLVMSDFVRREAIDVLELPPERVVTISAGVDDIFRAPPLGPEERRRVVEKYRIGGRFVFYYGGYDLHKNVECLIAAMAQIGRDATQHVDLVLAGPVATDIQQNLSRRAEESGLSPAQCHWLGQLADAELVDLLRAAEVFVFPSLREGFGLPVLEAMAAGAPVLCSDRSSLPEVVGNGVMLFDPARPPTLAAQLQRVLCDADFRKAIAEHGRQRAAAFSWDHAARRTWDAYEALTAQKGEERRITRAAATPVADIAEAVAEFLPRDVDDATLSDIAEAIAGNRPQPGPARLLVDVSVQARNLPGSGISRVVDRVATHLLDQSTEAFPVELVELDDSGGGFRTARDYAARLLGRPDVTGGDGPIELRVGDHFLALDLNYALAKRQPFFERLAQLGGRRSAIVYDLLPLGRPDWFPPSVDRAHAAWFSTVAGFDDLACISNAVADDVRRELDRIRPVGSRPRVGVFHLGSELPKEPAGTVPAAFQDRPTVLVVGVLWARKGQAFALEAFERLWAEGEQVNLAFAGRVGWGVEPLIAKLRSHPELGHRLFWFEGPDDALLAKLYREATGVLVPAEGEGFGLPLVEALQYGCPVLARDLPVFTEIAGEHFDRFGANTPEELAVEVRDWVRRIGEGATPTAERFRPLTWREATQQLLKALAVVPQGAVVVRLPGERAVEAT